MPAHTRASMTSLSASENRSKLRVVQDLLLNALKLILSVPKKFWSVFTKAPVAQAWPEGGSGKGGVKSGNRGLQTGVAGSNSGKHDGSAWVSGLPSVSASRIAGIYRQDFHWYLSFQQPIAASAAARFSIANKRALFTMSSPWLVASVRKMRLKSAWALSCQKIAASVWSAVRVVL